jgi:hypothetical protein
MKNWLIAIGIILIIGTAGASDLGTITFGQIILQIALSFVLIGIGYYGNLLLPKKKRAVLKIKRRAKSEYARVA